MATHLTDDVHCACGQPLHYSTPDARAQVERLIAAAGGDPLIGISVYDGERYRRFRVQRHYIALHGVSAQALLQGTVPGAYETT
jgi:hypothetical protein